jgi:hypothetical protein
MRLNRMRPLSFEGTREVLEEIEHGSPNTPERRRALQRVREIEAIKQRRQLEERTTAKK